MSHDSQVMTGGNTNLPVDTWKSLNLISYFLVDCQSLLFLQPATTSNCNLMTKCHKWTKSDEPSGTKKFPYLACQSRIKGSLEWVQYHSLGTEVSYLAFSWLPMTLNTTDKLRSRRTAVLKAPACPQEIPGESHHPLQARSCRHLEECLLTWGWITYNNV